MRILWVAVTRRALARGRRESFGAGLAWGALTCFMVAVLTVHVSLWWHQRPAAAPEIIREKPEVIYCVSPKE